MSNEDGTVWLVFNGEIYNHTALRRDLETKGHVFRTNCDTETIVHLYEEKGIDCVHDLNGMFAFAIWDERRRQVFLARDRIGIKPLYYTMAEGRLLFASEIKAILPERRVPRRVDQEALSLYLSFGAVPAPKTLFDGIMKLPAGHRLVVQADGQTRLESYWDAIFPQDRLAGETEEYYVQELRRLFTQSIERRMMSDVPFGVFLSGGIDSSLNVALMSQMMDRPVDTFSVAIQGDDASNEFTQARAVARHFGANHHEVTIAPRDFIEFLPRMAYHQDEPLADPVCVPLFRVAELARDNGTIVVQVGEGSDELFCGYRSFTRYLALDPYWRRFAALPGWIKRPIASVAKRAVSTHRASFIERAVRGEPLFWGGVEGLPEPLKHSMLNTFDGDNIVPAWVRRHYETRRQAGANDNLLDDMIYLELKHRLPELLLMRVDKMTMATSVEARVPFLDHELVRFALSIPPSLKFKNGQTKYILKQAARGIIPDWVIDRKKAGFCGSAENMVTPPVADAAEALVRQNSDLQDLLDWTPLYDFCDRTRRGDVRAGYHTWMLLNLALWHSVWIQQLEPEQLRL
ncbi:MAG: asparagine synthase (glutamine-hydrolyzing), partial [Dehalococcoidia bacterium]